MYPEFAKINDKEYKLNTDYKVGLRCFDVINDKSISDQERSLAVIYLLYGFIPEDNLDLFLDKAKKFLQCGETREEQEIKKKDMDFSKDRKYIYSSFRSDYNIDLDKEELHWWSYIDLIQGLTEKSSLSRVRELRNFDESTIKDINEKNKIIKAKKQVSLEDDYEEYTQEQLDIINSIYGKGGDNNG